jgi:mono/diheme cytochrome c family protein
VLLTTASRLGFATLAIGAAIALSAGAALAQSGAAPPPASAAAPDAAKLAKGKDLFANYGCGSCHSLADAGATGRVGPAFDGDSNLTEAFVADRVTNGQSVMPAFGGQMTPEEIAAIAAYVNHAAQK